VPPRASVVLTGPSYRPPGSATFMAVVQCPCTNSIGIRWPVALVGAPGGRCLPLGDCAARHGPSNLCLRRDHAALDNPSMRRRPSQTRYRRYTASRSSMSCLRVAPPDPRCSGPGTPVAATPPGLAR
jgi:hypothetical protein